MDPGTMLVVLLFAVLGSLLGMGSGLVPGMHVNTLALLLLAVSVPLLDGIVHLCLEFGLRPELAPLLLSVLIVAASVTHSFVDFLPSMFLGIPDESKVLSVLPAHRLLLAGQGGPALVCAATGSLIGATVALLLAVPLQLFMLSTWGCEWAIELACPYFLVLVAVLLIASEFRSRKVRTLLDARLGSVVEATTIISVLPVPSDRSHGRISGRVIRRSTRGFLLVNQHGKWNVLGPSPRLGANVIAEGVWSVRGRSTLAPLLALALFLASGWLGFLAMNAQLPLSDVSSGMGQSVLFPLLTGLFGFPSLLLSLRSRPVPQQEGRGEASVSLRRRAQGNGRRLPGRLVARDIVHHRDGDRLIVLPERWRGPGGGRQALHRDGVGRRNILGGLQPDRPGHVGAWSDRSAADGDAGPGAGRPGRLGLAPLRRLRRPAPRHSGRRQCSAISPRCGWALSSPGSLVGSSLLPLNLVVISFVLILVALFNGLSGLILLASASVLGLLPPLLGIGRVHLTGSMLFPLILFYFGWRDQLLMALGG